jgi:membrane-associated phospholipid phosphatase
VIDSVLKNIKKQPYFFLLYFAFLSFLVVILFKFSKTDGTLWANQYWSPFQDVLYRYMTYLGDFGMAAVVVLGLLFWKFKYAVIAIISFGATAGVTQFLKKIIYPDLLRPSLEMWDEMQGGLLHLVDGVEQLLGYTFPSGHTTSAFSIFCLLALLSKKKWVGVICIVFAALIGYSRIYLCQHFFEDVFVGALIGGIGSFLIYSFLETKKFGAWGEKSLLNLK